MNKFLILLSTISLFVVMIGTIFFDNNPTFWIANASLHYEIIRGIVAAMLTLQFITNPPRNRLFRGVTGLLAVGIGGWVLQASLHGSMMFLDSLSFMSAAVTMAIAALELRPVPRLATNEVIVND